MTPSRVGEILREYLVARNITQEEVAKITNSSTRHVSCVINGKQKLSYEFALKLEDVMPDVKAEFWIDIENQYQLYKLRLEKRYEYLTYDEDSEEDYEGEYDELCKELGK